MEDTSGFYKLDDQSLLFAPNGVSSAEFELHRHLQQTYEYPVSGWYWFESEEEAKKFFNLP